MTNRKKNNISVIITGLYLITIFSNAQTPVASFTTNQTSGCSPLTVQFTNTSVNASSYYWDFGNGNVSVLMNPSNVYSNAGTYTLKLFAIAANGQRDSIIYSNLITVSANSVPDFYAATTSACLEGNNFSFINTSSNAINYLWDFGDGNTSTLQHPNHSYMSQGNYTIKFITYDSYGCPSVKTISNYIYVNPNPVAEFTVNTTTGCDPDQVFNFTAADESGTNWLWNFGDGSSSILQNPNHTYSTSGLYTVSLITTNLHGCKDTVIMSDYISVTAPQPPVFTSDTITGCTPVQVSFSSQSPNTISWLWSFGDGDTSEEENPAHSYQNSGSYNVGLAILTDNGCSYITTINNYINIAENPVPNFSTTTASGCAPVGIQFINQSANAVSQLWDFGGGYTSTQQNPLHTYTQNGTYTVILHSFNASGCESIKEIINAVALVLPVADFTVNYTPGCAPLTAGFSNNSINAVQWIWNFGDGTYSNLQNPTHIYSLPGDYTISLIAIDDSGCSDTLIASSVIHVINTAANFTAPATTNGCVPFNTSFSNDISGAASWLWGFGDGSSSTQQNPSHAYTTAGFYAVSLTVYLNSGCMQHYPIFRTFDIKGVQPSFTCSALETCAPVTSIFTSTTPGNNISSWWEFGDGTTSALQNPSHTYTIPGFYTVKYTATTTDGCSATLVKANSIHAISCSSGYIGSNSGGGGINVWNEGTSTNSPPPPSITGCIPLGVSFNNSLSSTVSWLWNFGDGSTSTMQHPFHTYTTAGNYTVALIAYTPSGVYDTIIYPDYIEASGAAADFNITENGNCQATTITINTTSSDNDSWHWDFGDGSTSSLQNPTHTYYSATDNYIVTLTTTNAQGCSATLSKSMLSTVDNTLIWADDYTVCADQPVNFNCFSSNYAAWLWNFGDGSSSTLQNPAHTYQTAGSYGVILTVTDNNGCTHNSSLQYPITVSKPVADYSYTLANGCNYQTVNFTNTSAGAALPLSAHCKWNFGDGTVEQWAENPMHTFSSQGTYLVTLTVNDNSCFNSITKTVDVLPVIVDFSFTQNTTCLPVTAIFNDSGSSNSIAAWLWDFGDGTTSASQDPVHTFTTPPSTDVTLTITGANGCQAIITKPNITIFNTDFAVSIAEGCTPMLVAFTDASLNANQWIWDFGDGNYSTLQHPAHTYMNNGAYTVKLISKSVDGCADTMLFSEINVNKPVASFSSANATNCSPTLVSFTDSSTNADSWLWDFGDGSTSINQHPGHVYNIPGLYTIRLTVTNTIGCSDTLVRTDYIEVPGSIAGFTTSATQACAQTTVQFTDLSVNAANWSWNFGDGNSSSQKNPIHIYQYPGQYTVSLSIENNTGCSNSLIKTNYIHVYDQNPPAESVIKAVSVISDNTVQISWNQNNDENFTFYKIYRKNNTTGIYNSIATINSSSTTIFLDSNLNTLANSYCYKIQTIDFCGNALLLDSLKEHCTINVSAFGVNDNIQIHWTPYTGAVPETYSIYRVENNTLNPILIATVPGNSLTYTDTTLACPTYHSYRIKANKLNGLIASSNSDTCIAKPAYSHLMNQKVDVVRSTVIDNNNVLTEWAAPALAPEKIAGYAIYRSTDNIHFSLLTHVDAIVHNYIDTEVNVNSQNYYYKISIVNFCDITGEESNKSSSVLLKAGLADGSVNLSWTAYEGWDKGVDYYSIEKMNDSGEWETIQKVNGDILNYTDEN